MAIATGRAVVVGRDDDNDGVLPQHQRLEEETLTFNSSTSASILSRVTSTVAFALFNIFNI